jgi:hypothetical protein
VSFICPLIYGTLSNETIGFFVAFSLLYKANNFLTNFWHSGNKSDFLSILQKMQNMNNNEKSKYLLNYRFLNSKINEFYLELGMLTKNVIVMLLIVVYHSELSWYVSDCTVAHEHTVS